MHAAWPFFRSVLSNMTLGLAKTDLAIASRYAELVPDAALRASIFRRIAAEHARAVRHVLAITRQTGLLDDNPTLTRSIRNRFPYLDPLNHLQVELLRRHRAGQTDERTQRAIHLTINGLAAAWLQKNVGFQAVVDAMLYYQKAIWGNTDPAKAYKDISWLTEMEPIS